MIIAMAASVPNFGYYKESENFIISSVQFYENAKPSYPSKKEIRDTFGKAVTAIIPFTENDEIFSNRSRISLTVGPIPLALYFWQYSVRVIFTIFPCPCSSSWGMEIWVWGGGLGT